MSRDNYVCLYFSISYGEIDKPKPEPIDYFVTETKTQMAEILRQECIYWDIPYYLADQVNITDTWKSTLSNGECEIKIIHNNKCLWVNLAGEDDYYKHKDKEDEYRRHSEARKERRIRGFGWKRKTVSNSGFDSFQ